MKDFKSISEAFAAGVKAAQQQAAIPDTWAWTNDERTEARRGRWQAVRGKSSEGLNTTWGFKHDDFAGFLYWVSSPSDDNTMGIDPCPWRTILSFFAWRAAQTQPDEPTGLGAVVDTPYHNRLVRVPSTEVAAGPWFSEDAHRRFTWDQIAGGGGVKVLSEGVK